MNAPLFFPIDVSATWHPRAGFENPPIDLTRMRGPVDAALTFPALRAMVQEVSSLPFASRPTYVNWLPDAQAKHQLRI
jgi:hypothetical protein